MNPTCNHFGFSLNACNHFGYVRNFNLCKCRWEIGSWASKNCEFTYSESNPKNNIETSLSFTISIFIGPKPINTSRVERKRARRGSQRLL